MNHTALSPDGSKITIAVPRYGKQRFAIIGAGPYGLSAGAYLRAAGAESIVFGEPMGFWHSRMPQGMMLRSAWYASSISDPAHALSLDAYERAHRLHISLPIPLCHFLDYGMWFQRESIPDLQRRRVLEISHNGTGFQLILEDNEPCYADRVIIAAGIEAFAYTPAVFDSVKSFEELVSHSSQHRNFASFAGQSVLVVGAGQSALESAALLSEAGAQVELIARNSRIYWLTGKARLRRDLTGADRLLRSRADVGPPILTHIVSRPGLLKLFPPSVRDWMVRRAIRPAGAAWVRARLNGVRITTGREIMKAEKLDGGLQLTLDDGSRRVVDHAILATGYRVDVSRYQFLAPQLLAQLRRYQGYPILGPGLESSVPGLHFLGACGAWSFGPLMRFVSGTEYSSRALINYVLGVSRFG
jgi:cation diffusion facilitator CzcD-associated flavoprotein CzcO